MLIILSHTHNHIRKRSCVKQLFFRPEIRIFGLFFPEDPQFISLFDSEGLHFISLFDSEGLQLISITALKACIWLYFSSHGSSIGFNFS